MSWSLLNAEGIVTAKQVACSPRKSVNYARGCALHPGASSSGCTKALAVKKSANARLGTTCHDRCNRIPRRKCDGIVTEANKFLKPKEQPKPSLTSCKYLWKERDQEGFRKAQNAAEFAGLAKCCVMLMLATANG